MLINKTYMQDGSNPMVVLWTMQLAAQNRAPLVVSWAMQHVPPYVVSALLIQRYIPGGWM